MAELFFTSNEDDEYFIIPSVQLDERPKPLLSGEELHFTLPKDLCGPEEPTLHESLGVLRFLAFRLARVLYIAEWPDGLAWYESYYEDTSFDDYLEVATALLAALRTTVDSTSKTGEINVYFLPIVEELEQFFLNDFVPIAHYLRAANPDGDEDFEYDFDNASFSEDALKKIYSFVNFYKTKRIVDLDPLLRKSSERSGENGVVAVRIKGISTLQPKREFTQPIDQVMLSILGVLQFFKYSSEYGDLYAGFNDDDDPTLEQLQKDRDEYIQEFPDEEDVADETFNEEAHGEMMDFNFIAETTAIDALGITSIAEAEDGWISATLVLPADPLEHLRNFGISPENEWGYDDPFVDYEPTGLVRLGWYEYYFFTPDEDEEDED